MYDKFEQNVFRYCSKIIYKSKILFEVYVSTLSLKLKVHIFHHNIMIILKSYNTTYIVPTTHRIIEAYNAVFSQVHRI